MPKKRFARLMPNILMAKKRFARLTQFFHTGEM
jgi:hypothetical protein